jgi:hypothetical protein
MDPFTLADTCGAPVRTINLNLITDINWRDDGGAAVRFSGGLLIHLGQREAAMLRGWLDAAESPRADSYDTLCETAAVN